MHVIKGAKVVDGALIVILEDEKELEFEDCWLRDNCRCRTCYHAHTFQRALHLLDVPEAGIQEVEVTKSQICIKWEDGHLSTFDLDFLIKYDYSTWKAGLSLKHSLWRGAEVGEKVTRIHVDKFLNTEDGAKMVFQSLLDYGVVLVYGVEATLEATEQVCKALGGVQHTVFGGMWRFSTVAEHADTAYTDLPLAAHNDNTYFTEAAGLQILHCLEHSNGTGGETVLVDGFYGATLLQEQFPEDYEFLTSFDVEAEYIEEGHHHKYSAPVIQINKETKQIKQIRYNVYDRAPMAFRSGAECRAYYRALRRLGRQYEDPQNQWRFKLSPGVVMAMDNFRVLHGRTGFTGSRVMCGSYVARSDWLDRARALRLLQ